jgi:hypothetical protein
MDTDKELFDGPDDEKEPLKIRYMVTAIDETRLPIGLHYARIPKKHYFQNLRNLLSAIQNLKTDSRVSDSDLLVGTWL